METTVDIMPCIYASSRRIRSESPLPAPIMALKTSIASELIAKPFRMSWFECRCGETLRAVQLVNKTLHPFTSADNRSRWLTFLRWACSPAFRKPAYGHRSCQYLSAKLSFFSTRTTTPLVWHSSLRNGGSQIMQSMVPLRFAFTSYQLPIPTQLLCSTYRLTW